jgi:O-antigen ligase
VFKTFIFILLFIIIPNIYVYESGMGLTYSQFILFCYTTLAILAFAGYRFLRNPFDLKIKLNLLDLSIILFLIINLISTIFSKSIYASLFGGWGHSPEGVIAIACFTILYFYLSSIVRKENLKKIVLIMLLGILFAAFWGFLYPGEATKYASLPLRVRSTQLSPIFFANYLLFGLPLSIALIASKGKFAVKTGVVSALLITFSLILSLTRSAWVSLLIISAMFIKKVPIKIILFCFAALLITFFLFTPLKNRVVSTLKEGFDDNSVSIRLLESKSALSIIKDCPILGTGPDTIAYVYPKYRSEELNKDPREWYRQTPYIRMYFLQVGATLGILGLISFLGIIIASILLYIKYIKALAATERVYVSGIFFAYLALVIHYFFYTTTLTIEILFWSSIGIIGGIIRRESSQKYYFSFNLSTNFFKWAINLGVLFWLLTIFILSLDLYSNYIYIGRNKAGDLKEGGAIVKRAVALNPTSTTFLSGQIAINTTFLFEMNKQGKIVPEADQIFKESEEVLDKMQRLDPLNPAFLYSKALYLFQKFKVVKYTGKDRTDEFNQAEKAAKFAISLNPTNPNTWDLLTVIYLDADAKKLKEAEESARESLRLKSDFQLGYHHLAESLKQQGRFKEAIEVYEESLKYDPQNSVLKRQIEEIKKLIYLQ